MALATVQFVTQTTGPTSDLRMFPETVQVKTFATGTEVMVRGTLVAFNTTVGFWVPWTVGGANGAGTALGILNEPRTQNPGGEVQANVMLTGRIHRADIVSQFVATAPEVTAAVISTFRGLGIIVEGLAGVR